MNEDVGMGCPGHHQCQTFAGDAGPGGKGIS